MADVRTGTRARKRRSPIVAIYALLLSLVVPALSLVTSTSAAGVMAAECHLFQETDRSVCGEFLRYWNEHGGVIVQGYPLSSEMKEQSSTDGKSYTVQYFERARFELHPENRSPFNVLLSHLGRYEFERKYPSGKAQEIPPEKGGEAGLYFSQTGKEVRGNFLIFWKRYGGLSQWGYPISGVILEDKPVDPGLNKPAGQLSVQYFERGKLEIHDENADTAYYVLAARLGAAEYERRYRQGGTTLLTNGTWGGDQAAMNVTATGAHIEFGCAHADLNGSIRLDSQGMFRATGTFVKERGGPVIDDNPGETYPATFEGNVAGNTLTLTIFLTNQTPPQKVGTYTLTLGRQVKIVHCL